MKAAGSSSTAEAPGSGFELISTSRVHERASRARSERQRRRHAISLGAAEAWQWRRRGGLAGGRVGARAAMASNGYRRTDQEGELAPRARSSAHQVAHHSTSREVGERLGRKQRCRRRNALSHG